MNTKFLTLASVFTISSLVYFALFKNFVLDYVPAKATGGEVTVSFLEDKITAVPGVAFDTNIFFNSTDPVDNAAVSFSYGPDIEYVRPRIGNDYVSAVCQANGFQFQGLVEVFFDDIRGVGYIFRHVILKDGQLKPPIGYFCYTTLSFKYSNFSGSFDPNNPASISFRNPNSPECTIGDPMYDPMCRWDMFGPKGLLTAKLEPNKSRIQVLISGGSILPTNTPIPTNPAGLIPSPTTPAGFLDPTSTPVPIPSPTSAEVSCATCPPELPYCEPGFNQKIMDCIYGSQPPGFDCMTLDINRDGKIDGSDISAARICRECFCSITPTSAPTQMPTSTPYILATPTTAYTFPSPTPTTAYTFPSPTPTTAYTLPTSTIIIDECPNIIKGNYDCSLDRLITLSDYEAFRVAFFKYNRQKVYTETADGNQDGINNLDDFEIFRANLTQGSSN